MFADCGKQGIMYLVSLYYIFWYLVLESGLLVQFPCSTTLVCPFKCIYHSHHRWNMRMCTFVDSSHQDEPLSSLVCWTACISFLVAFDFEFTNNQQKLYFNVSLLLFETGIISVFLLCNHCDLLYEWILFPEFEWKIDAALCTSKKDSISLPTSSERNLFEVLEIKYLRNLRR